MIQKLLISLFLILPLLGLYQALKSVVDGPNYFAERRVLLEKVEKYASVSKGTRSGNTEERDVWFEYSFAARDGHVIRADDTAHIHNLPVAESRFVAGAKVRLRVPVPEDEGKFGLNRGAEQGLTMALVFGLMAVPAILIVRKKNPEVIALPVAQTTLEKHHARRNDRPSRCTTRRALFALVPESSATRQSAAISPY